MPRKSNFMGLDMYLTKRTYVGGNYKHNEVAGSISITKGGKLLNIDLKRVSYISEEVGYWRKANHIHKWFVDNCGDGRDECQDMDVSEEQLRDLLKTCKEVIEKCPLEVVGKEMVNVLEGGEFKQVEQDKKVVTNPEIAGELLPTASGFFFGSTEYDEYYFGDIQETVEIIENLLEEGIENADIVYRASW